MEQAQVLSITISGDQTTLKQLDETVLIYGYQELDRKVEKEGSIIAEQRFSTLC